MIRTLITVIIYASLFSSCQTQTKNKETDNQQTQSDSLTQKKPFDIPYEVAKNYFVKNTFKQDGLQDPKIESKEVFDSVFATATTMNTKPTKIDFSKQYIIAIVGNTTDTATEFSPLSLQKMTTIKSS